MTIYGNFKISPRPNAMVLFNPAMGLAHDNPRLKGFASNRRTDGSPEKVWPLTYASKKQPPGIMFFGTADVLLKGAELFRKDSVKAGNTCKIVTYKDQKHGFFNYGKSGGKYYKLTLAEMDKFLVELEWLPPK